MLGVFMALNLGIYAVIVSVVLIDSVEKHNGTHVSPQLQSK